MLATSGLSAAADEKSDVYAKDVEFMLQELPKKAGHFFETKGVDWKSVSEEFTKAVKDVHSDEEHVKLCNRLVARLKDGHAGLVDLKVKYPDESQGRRFTGPRVHLVMVGDKAYVRTAFGPAADQGAKAGMEVLEIDGKPALKFLEAAKAKLSDESGFSTAQMAMYSACHAGLADWEGTPITFKLAEGAKKSEVKLVRQGGPNFVPIGPVFPPKDLKTVGRQSYGKTTGGMGYIHLRDVPGELPEQLDQMLQDLGDVPGLILDCRANGGGGCDHDAVFGRFLPKGYAWRQYKSAGPSPYAGPMVVIVDAGVRSAGETIAGQFKEDGRAWMIGDTPTAGMSASKDRLEVPSGMFKVYYAVASNKGRFNGGKGIEGIGVPPNEVTPYDPKDLLKGVDTQIRRAEEILKAGLTKDKVAYQPKKKNLHFD
ncbi:S41 family peptidase [Luteolibacter soli]|uniref:S41 family peptidase n=1 Tax=Luteolibacter soli TaxID=3135280 RepID=A0ABU9ASX9_9BACT